MLCASTFASSELVKLLRGSKKKRKKIYHETFNCKKLIDFSSFHNRINWVPSYQTNYIQFLTHVFIVFIRTFKSSMIRNRKYNYASWASKTSQKHTIKPDLTIHLHGESIRSFVFVWPSLEGKWQAQFMTSNNLNAN